MRLMSIDNTKPGYPVAKTIYDSFGRVLLVKGAPLTHDYIQRLKKLKFKSVYIDYGHSELIEVDDIICEETRNEVFNTVREALLGVKAGKTVQEEKIKQSVNSLIKEIMSNQDTVIFLNDIRTMQDHTFSHSVNVCILALMTGLSMGYNHLKLKEIGTGALLHDIGKALVLEEVNSDNKLSDSRFKLVQKHCEYGFEVLKNTKGIGILSAYVAWQHHERFNGSGYPKGLSGKAIQEYARIVAVADVYDALVNDRPHRERMLAHQVIDLINSNTELNFDPDIVPEFVSVIAPYPVNSIVLLNSGLIGKVVEIKKINPTRPKVKLLFDVQGQAIDGVKFIDLLTDSSDFILDVLGK